jgi:hypothetical protein
LKVKLTNYDMWKAQGPNPITKIKTILPIFGFSDARVFLTSWNYEHLDFMTDYGLISYIKLHHSLVNGNGA